MSHPQSGSSFDQWSEYSTEATNKMDDKRATMLSSSSSVYPVDRFEIEGQATYDIVSAYTHPSPPPSSRCSEMLSPPQSFPQQMHPIIISSMTLSRQNEKGRIPKWNFRNYTLYRAEDGVCCWYFSIRTGIGAVSIVWIIYALYIIAMTLVINYSATKEPNGLVNKLGLNKDQINLHVISTIVCSAIIATGSLYGMFVVILHNNYRSVKIYSIIAWFNLVLIFSFWVGNLILMQIHHAPLMSVLVGPALAITLLSIYFAILIQSYTNKLRLEEKPALTRCSRFSITSSVDNKLQPEEEGNLGLQHNEQRGEKLDLRHNEQRGKKLDLRHNEQRERLDLEYGEQREEKLDLQYDEQRRENSSYDMGWRQHGSTINYALKKAVAYDLVNHKGQ